MLPLLITLLVSWCPWVALAHSGIVRNGKAYRSVLGDPGMRWKPTRTEVATAGPRMQLFFYSLCSKAMPANFTVVPAASDTCSEPVPGRIGQGGVERVKSDDCCKECLTRSWCLAWTEVSPGMCLLKDNALPEIGPSPPMPDDYKPHAGNCGDTSYKDAKSCNGTDLSGALRAREHGLTSLELCKHFCESCSACTFVSFSMGEHGSEHDHNDCSWYSECDLHHLATTGANYTSLRVKNHSSGWEIRSGVRQYNPDQRVPSPRYGNCIVDGKQTVTTADNAAQVPEGVDEEWFAVTKEHMLAEKCQEPAPGDASAGATPSFFWTVMSQNGNAPGDLGSDASCVPQCYHQADDVRPAGWPPAVNASPAICPSGRANSDVTTLRGRRLFNNQPMNQAKVMVGYTDPFTLRGKFNWTFELDQDLAVPETEFPLDKSLGVWEWWYDEEEQKGFTRIYTRVSKEYPWICAYFGADHSMGVKANQAYEGRGMMTETPKGKDFIVRFFLNITGFHTGSGVGSWYAPNMEACWDQKTRKPCTPYGDTNAMVHQQVLLDYSGRSKGGPPFHILRNGTKVSRSDPRYPKDAYKEYCCPCESCEECGQLGLACCDAYSNSNGQSIYKIAPHPEWAHWGFPANASDGWIGNPKMHELNVGGLFSQIWFPCMTTEPIEIITVNIGPETGLGSGDHSTEFIVSDFDVLVPVESSENKLVV